MVSSPWLFQVDRIVFLYFLNASLFSIYSVFIYLFYNPKKIPLCLVCLDKTHNQLSVKCQVTNLEMWATWAVTLLAVHVNNERQVCIFQVEEGDDTQSQPGSSRV